MYCIEHDGKEYYICTKEHFEDYLREVCGEEAFEAYKDLVAKSHDTEVEDLKDELSATEDARKSYEWASDDYYNKLNGVYRLCQEFRKEVAKSLRLNRKKIMGWVGTIERRVKNEFRRK